MYITDVVTLPRFYFGRGVYRRFPELCKGLGARFALVGGNTAMEKGLPSLKGGRAGSGMQLLCALPFGGACTLAAMDALTAQIDPMRPDFLVGMGGNLAATIPQEGMLWQAVVFEAILTFGMVLLVLSMANGPELTGPFIPLAVGAYVMAMGTMAVTCCQSATWAVPLFSRGCL